jgi:hypothetical protein
MKIFGYADDELNLVWPKTSAGFQRGGAVFEAKNREGLATGGLALPGENPTDQPIRRRVRAAWAGGR